MLQCRGSCSSPAAMPWSPVTRVPVNATHTTACQGNGDAMERVVTIHWRCASAANDAARRCMYVDWLTCSLCVDSCCFNYICAYMFCLTRWRWVLLHSHVRSRLCRSSGFHHNGHGFHSQSDRRRHMELLAHRQDFYTAKLTDACYVPHTRLGLVSSFVSRLQDIDMP